MTFRENVLRTCGMNFKPLTVEQQKLALGALGLTGEAGEAADVIKKHIFHEQPLDRDKLIKELGDTLWYWELIALTLGVTMEEIQQVNINKLLARYPVGFTPQASAERADEKKAEAA